MRNIIKKLSFFLVIVVMVSTIAVPAVSTAAAELPTIKINSDSHNMVVVTGDTTKLNFTVTKTHETQKLYFEFYNQNNHLIASSSAIIYKNGQSVHTHTLNVNTAAIDGMVRGAYKLVFYVHYLENGYWRSTGTTGTDYLFVVNASDFIREGNADRYFSNGIPVYDTQLVKHNGKWFYLDKGLWTDQPTTLLKINGKWFFVEKGMWTAKTALVKYQNKYFYVKGGKWSSNVNDLIKYNGKHFYIKNGKWANTATTLVKKNGKYLYVKNGKWSQTDAIVKYSGKKFYVKKGIAQTSFSGKAVVGGKTYKIKNGKVV